MRKPELHNVKVETVPDEHPEVLSHLGEYGDEWYEGCIDRKERGDQGRRELRYFLPASPGAVDADYERCEAYNSGQWTMLGVRATGELRIPHGAGGGWITQTLTSPGLWGVESDSDQSYIDEVGAEEIETLWGMAEALGCERQAVTA